MIVSCTMFESSEKKHRRLQDEGKEKLKLLLEGKKSNEIDWQAVISTAMTLHEKDKKKNRPKHRILHNMLEKRRKRQEKVKEIAGFSVNLSSSAIEDYKSSRTTSTFSDRS